jgi:Domain of unknown function (DUF4381)
MQQPATQQYGELMEPKPVPFSFHAPGWYVADVLLLIVLLLLIFGYIRYYYRNRYRREALQWLNQQHGAHHVKRLYEADMLMKRIAMHVYGPQAVATLQGTAWINFLNKCNRRTYRFTEDDSRLLFDAFYRNPQAVSEADTNIFISKTRNWIRYHHHALRHRI